MRNKFVQDFLVDLYEWLIEDQAISIEVFMYYPKDTLLLSRFDDIETLKLFLNVNGAPNAMLVYSDCICANTSFSIRERESLVSYRISRDTKVLSAQVGCEKYEIYCGTTKIEGRILKKAEEKINDELLPYDIKITFSWSNAKGYWRPKVGYRRFPRRYKFDITSNKEWKIVCTKLPNKLEEGEREDLQRAIDVTNQYLSVLPASKFQQSKGFYVTSNK